MSATYYYFVADGVEVIACEAYEVNARDTANTLNKKSGDECHHVYSLTPVDLNDMIDGHYVHAFERKVCLDSYELSNS